MIHKNKLKKTAKDLFKTEKEIIVFDTETTGLDEKAQIIQFSAIKGTVYKADDGRYKFRQNNILDIYIKPNDPVSEFISDLTGITNDFLEDKDTEEIAFSKIKNFMGTNPIISGYNVPFDIRMTSALYQRNNENFSYAEFLDVIQMARDLISKDDFEEAGLETSFKQCNVAALYGYDKGVAFHSSIEDTKVCLRLLLTFLNEYDEEPSIEKVKPTVISIAYNDKFKHDTHGAWLISKPCNMYYSYKNKQWYPCKKEDMEIAKTIDLDALEEEVLKRLGLNCIEEIKDFKGIIKSKRICKSIQRVSPWIKNGHKRIYMYAYDDQKFSDNIFYDIKNDKWHTNAFDEDSVRIVARTNRYFNAYVAANS